LLVDVLLLRIVVMLVFVVFYAYLLKVVPSYRRGPCVTIGLIRLLQKNGRTNEQTNFIKPRIKMTVSYAVKHD